MENITIIAMEKICCMYDRLRQWKENGKKIDLPVWENRGRAGNGVRSNGIINA